MTSLKWIHQIGVIFLLSIFIISTVQAVTKYSKEERVALDKFRPMVIDVLTRDHQKIDSYLILWLRARNLDLKAANQMLRKAQKWRKDNKVDTILEEPNIYDTIGFPDSIDEVDREGRPIMSYSVSKVPHRRLFLEGKYQKLLRGNIQLFEKMALKSVEASNRTGTEISDFVILADIQGFSRQQHACLQCIPFAQEWTNMIESYYPGTIHLGIFVNVPRAYSFLSQRTLPLSSPHTQKTTKVFGHNKAEWSAFIDKYVAPNQRTYQFGGTKKKQ